MIEHNGGDWSQTVSGKRIFFSNPSPESIDIMDIAHGLSMQCRFGGQVPVHYSVAQHCCYVVRILREKGYNEDTQFTGLMHDSAEAYLVDIPRPVKKYLPVYQEMEDKLLKVIFSHFCVSMEFMAEAKWADEICLRTEARDLMGNPSDWVWDPSILLMEWKIEPVSNFEAREMFLEEFNRLFFR